MRKLFFENLFDQQFLLRPNPNSGHGTLAITRLR
jgi:hypothetical protein